MSIWLIICESKISICSFSMDYKNIIRIRYCFYESYFIYSIIIVFYGIFP
nr:MAG TPA: hypothetical protein [Caudoviricetes sp.]